MSNYFKIKYQFAKNRTEYLIGTFKTSDAFKEMDRLSHKLQRQNFERINPMLIQRGEEKYFMELVN